MKGILTGILVSVWALSSGCAMVDYPPYQFYEGGKRTPAEVSIIKPHRSFGGPAVILRTVDSKHVLDYPSMSGYPKDQVDATP